MFTYYIKFSGLYPVGACALVHAASQDNARIKFLEYLKINYPHVYRNNTRLDLSEFVLYDPKKDGEVLILLNGDY